MNTNFKFPYCNPGTNETTQYDMDDVFVRRDIFSEGGLYLWGCNAAGSLGINSSLSQSSPVQTVSGGTNWKQVDVVGGTSAGIKTDGTLWIWGCGNTGRLGTNSTISLSSPVQTVSTGTNWKQVSTGCTHSGGIKTDGTLWIWGCGGSGGLGHNSIITQSSPVQTVSTGTNWKQVTLSVNASAATKTDGTLWLWGLATSGQLGNSSTIDVSSPVQTVSTGTNWKQVSIGNSYSAAIKTDGTLWMWGLGTGGRLGNNGEASQSSPVQTVSTGTNWKQVSVNLAHTAAIKTDGTLWLWGFSSDGKLGNNSLIHRSSPVQTVSTGTNWKQVSVGANHSAATKTDGTLWLWGRGDIGLLGNFSTIRQSSPVQTITTGTNWKEVVAKDDSTSGIREDCW